MESLPPEIVANILSRTHDILRTRIRCRDVCKKWRSVFSEPSFTDVHLSLSTCLVTHVRNSFNIFELELDDETGQINMYHDPIITIKYECSKNQYKVVRFDQFRNNPYQSDCEVYTLGTGIWRNIGHFPFGIGRHQDSVLFNGNLHWLVHDQQHITSDIVCTFDLGKELSILTASAPIVNETRDKPYSRSLGVLGGCLCICDNTSASEIVIWVVKDYGMKECWNKEIVIEKDLYNREQLYGKRVHVMAEPKDGFILIGVNYYTGTHMCTEGFSYHRRSKKLQRLGNTPVSQFDRRVMVYVPNFISLKSIMSEPERVLTF